MKKPTKQQIERLDGIIASHLAPAYPRLEFSVNRLDGGIDVWKLDNPDLLRLTQAECRTALGALRIVNEFVVLERRCLIRRLRWLSVEPKGDAVYEWTKPDAGPYAAFQPDCLTRNGKQVATAKLEPGSGRWIVYLTHPDWTCVGSSLRLDGWETEVKRQTEAIAETLYGQLPLARV